MLIVFLLCVMRTNCVLMLISFTSSVKRPILASSSGASTSSRMQNGLGVYWKLPTSRARAVSAFSPPESSSTLCKRLPGGDATTSMPLSAEFSSSVSFIKAWPPPKSFLEVAVDFGEGFLEFLARNFVNLSNGRGRILDGGDEILALSVEERVALRALFIFFERHHVHRTHGFELGTHLAIRLIAGRKLVPGHAGDCAVGEQHGALDAEFVQAGFCHVHA